MITPRVTVLTPVYNGLPYLKESIESTLAQSMKDFELLVIVDGVEGNKDGSYECARAYAAEDPRIHVILNEQNLGTSKTMNKGIELARAPYVARLDQDDVSLPNRLHTQLAYLEAHPELSIVCSWEYGIDGQSRRVRNWRGRIENYGGFLGPLLVNKCPIWHPSIMFKKDAMLEAGGYNKAYQPCEDFELTMQLALKGYRAAIVPEYLVAQRHHGQRQSVTKLNSQAQAAARVHQEMIERFYRGADAAFLGRFLRMDRAFFSQLKSKEEVLDITRAFIQMTLALSKTLKLTDEEYNIMMSVVYSRLGRGVKYAEKLRNLPVPLFFTAFFGLSPFLSPTLHSIASRIYEFVHELRYPYRLLRAGLERRDK